MTWVHSGIAGSQAGGVAVKPADGGAIDAFARQRFSEPFTLFDSKQIWNDPDITDTSENFPLFFDNQEISGGGTTTLFNVNRASTTLGVAANTAGHRVRQTKQHFNYQPGKSQLIILTGVANQTKSGNIKRLGYHNASNGLFFEDNGGAWSTVVRSSVSGVAIDNAIAQGSWNLDPLNGNGPSGIRLEPGNAQITFIDFEWLAVGRVRFGFVIDGKPIYCHQYLHANNIGSAYMSTPNLPVRCEIINNGTGGADIVEQICATVISEGGIQPSGVSRWSDIGTTSAQDITAATIGTVYAICGIRLKQNYLSADVRLERVSIIENSGANNPFLWRLHLNPTLTSGSLTYANVSNSAVQFGTGAPAGDVITGLGTILAGGYQSRNDATASIAINTALRLGSTIAGVSDRLVVSGTPITTNQVYFGGLQWREAW